MRSTPLWKGRTDDAAVPARVRIRVFERFDGRCYLTGRKIMPGDRWELDHIVALANGGSHDEANLAPALASAHKEKTKADVKTKSKVARIKAKHIGADRKKGRPIPGSKRSGWKKPMNKPAERRA